MLCLELLLDAIPQPGDDVARAVAVDRLVESQGGIDHQIGDVRLRALAQVAEQEAQNALARSRRRRHVLVDRRQRGLRQEDGKGEVARSLAPPVLTGGGPQGRPGGRDRLTQRTGGAHQTTIRKRGEGGGGWAVERGGPSEGAAPPTPVFRPRCPP